MGRVIKTIININIIYWLVTNYICYIYWYEHTLSGFLRCYILAIPFFFTALLKTGVLGVLCYEMFSMWGRATSKQPKTGC